MGSGRNEAAPRRERDMKGIWLYTRAGLDRAVAAGTIADDQFTRG